MLGVVDNLKYWTTLGFKDQNDVIYLVGDSHDDIGSSEYLRRIHGVEHSPAPYFDLEEEKRLHAAITGLIQGELIKSAHDVADGGLFQCLMESAIEGGHGITVDSVEAFRADAFWFGEAQGRVVVTADEARAAGLEDSLRDKGVGFTVLGRVLGDNIVVDGDKWGELDEYMTMHQLTLGALLTA